ncbi:hypothetical protein HanXRQr2_Chr11g0506651 [Helianthus annuus]|uniref:Uncharacterized protein n=1 Tax=Helianthus annuus TaxID=4232 RepID=A0A251S6S2_HELAN|nr:hypothetical protein HanXRQr2_Chr11g0506651 [Helianthus annuus]KAJ0876421.1 hypothetical protein HanPSC8_Chr11g0488231 [Helianthus annuus]
MPIQIIFLPSYVYAVYSLQHLLNDYPSFIAVKVGRRSQGAKSEHHIQKKAQDFYAIILPDIN